MRTVAGPDAGREIELAAGTSTWSAGPVRSTSSWTIRRWPSRQAVLRVDPDGAVTVTDLCSPRPTRAGGQVVDGRDLAAAGPAADDGQLDARRSRPVDGEIALRPAGRRPRAGPCGRDGGRVGRLDRRPPPAAARARLRCPSPRCGCPPPAAPPPAPPSPAGAAIVVTLTGGAVVSLLLHQPTFLILSSIGALGTLATALWPRLRRRARRRADGERARAAVGRPSPPTSRPTRRPSRRACGPAHWSCRRPWRVPEQAGSGAVGAPGRRPGRVRRRRGPR